MKTRHKNSPDAVKDFRGHDFSKSKVPKGSSNKPPSTCKDPTSVLAAACAEEANLARCQLETQHAERILFLTLKANKHKFHYDDLMEEWHMRENCEKHQHDLNMRNLEIEQLKLQLQLAGAHYTVPSSPTHCQWDLLRSSPTGLQTFNHGIAASGTSSPFARSSSISSHGADYSFIPCGGVQGSSEFNGDFGMEGEMGYSGMDFTSALQAQLDAEAVQTHMESQ
jgi:hypothetical protein